MKIYSIKNNDGAYWSSKKLNISSKPTWRFFNWKKRPTMGGKPTEWSHFKTAEKHLVKARKLDPTAYIVDERGRMVVTETDLVLVQKSLNNYWASKPNVNHYH